MLDQDHTLSDDEKEGLYAYAFDAYTCENYIEAVKIFKYLTVTSTLNAKYWKGLASSYQLLQQFQEALNCWSMVVILDEMDAMAHFHAAQCLMALNQPEEALKAITACQEMASFDKNLQSLLNQLKTNL